jgi:soluble methane monooxygenase-binding protein MmoD
VEQIKSENEPDALRPPSVASASEMTEDSADGKIVANASIEIFNRGRYKAFVEDLEFMWRWKIHRDGEFVQEGCSLSESSSREAVGHVMEFYLRRDQSRAAETP